MLAPIERVIRFAAVAVCALCVAAAVIAPLPGSTRYVDRNDCLGAALSAIVATHSGAGVACTSDEYAAETMPAGSAGLAVILVPTAMIGGLVAWRPRTRWAVLWSAGSLAIFVTYFIATFKLDLFSRDRFEVHAAAYVLERILPLIGAIPVVLLLSLAGHATASMLRARWRRNGVADANLLGH